MRPFILALLLSGCGASHGGSCTLDTVDTDCAASCGSGDGGPSDWPCKTDPLCVDGHWKFDCK